MLARDRAGAPQLSTKGPAVGQRKLAPNRGSPSFDFERAWLLTRRQLLDRRTRSTSARKRRANPGCARLRAVRAGATGSNGPTTTSRKRAPWIQRQKRFFIQFQPRTPERKYVSGETHLYLGRQYKLKVVPHIQQEVKLCRGRLIVQSLKPKKREVKPPLAMT